MPSYVAMLRGINVSGSKPVKMDALRASFEALGFKNVRTYVQSGNVVFEAKERAAAPLARRSRRGSNATSGSTCRCWSSAPASSRGSSTRTRSSNSAGRRST